MKQKFYVLQKLGEDEEIHFFIVQDNGVDNITSIQEASWHEACETDFCLLERAVQEIDNELVIMEVIPQFRYIVYFPLA